MTNIRITIEYDGSNYCGWQIQPNGRSVQQTIEEAIFTLTEEECRINGSGRTDSGVHAKGQVANFFCDSGIPPEVFFKALNRHLPKDISIISSCEAESDFHARFSAIGKNYRYLILNREARSPFFEKRAHRVPKKLNVESMRKAASEFLGTHDFKGFMASKSQVTNTVRTISDLAIITDGDLISINISGSGFLYNMVRIIAGTLLDCGLGKTNPDEIKKIVDSGIRENAGPTLPAHGLYLVEVFYPDKIHLKEKM